MKETVDGSGDSEECDLLMQVRHALRNPGSDTRVLSIFGVLARGSKLQDRSALVAILDTTCTIVIKTSTFRSEYEVLRFPYDAIDGVFETPSRMFWRQVTLRIRTGGSLKTVELVQIPTDRARRLRRAIEAARSNTV